MGPSLYYVIGIGQLGFVIVTVDITIGNLWNIQIYEFLQATLGF